MAIASLQDLLVHELRDLLSAERQITRALPKLIKRAGDSSLQEALEEHLAQTEGHVVRLEECLEQLGVAPRARKCKGMEGLLEEGDEAAEAIEDEDIRDAAIIGGCQRVEHYEIAAYGTARAFAERLGEDGVVARLTETLEEEAAANERLTTLAESGLNSEAMTGADRAGKRG